MRASGLSRQNRRHDVLDDANAEAIWLASATAVRLYGASSTSEPETNRNASTL
jgi:hypothetical protein